MKKISIGISIFFSLAMAGFLSVANIAQAQEQAEDLSAKQELYFFHSDSCPHCQDEEKFLPGLEQDFPGLEIKKYEISDPEGRRLYNEMASQAGVPEQAAAIGAVPLTIINGKYFLGFRNEETTGKEIRDYLEAQFSDGRACQIPQKREYRVNIFGREIVLGQNASLYLLGTVFGLADGINPCMFAVLLMLLAYLTASGSPRRALLAGLVFSLCVFAIYYAMMYGVYESLCLLKGSFLSFVDNLKLFFGAVFLVVGIWMAKDYFFLKEGQKVSFAIPKFAHPTIKKLAGKSTLPAAAALALFSSLVELPCTFALPLGYTTILLEKGVSPHSYLLVYNLFFVIPLFIIVGLTGYGLAKIQKIELWRDRSRKIMRLVSGILLIILGFAFILKLL